MCVRPRAIRPPIETNKDRKTHSGLMILIPCASLRLSFNLLMGLRRERERKKRGELAFILCGGPLAGLMRAAPVMYTFSIISFAN